MAGFVAPILGTVLPALAGLFGGGQQQRQTSNQQGTSSQTGFTSSRSTSSPNLNPFQQTLASLFSGGAADMYKQSLNMNPYTTQGLQQIQGQGQGNARSISNNLASRGLSFSPAGANAQTQNTLNTGNQMNSFLQGIPLLQRQLQTSALDEMMKAFQAMPYGTTSDQSGQSSQTGETSSSGTQTQYGNPLAGLFGGAGAGLFAPGQNGSSNLQNIINMFRPKLNPSSPGYVDYGSGAGSYG